jgi:NAD-dependent dihydropyrimidine dehydrogenase PreA subunit
MDEKFAKWKGVDRTKIDWSPRIDKKKCTGCGMCVTTCGRSVFDFDFAENKSVTARPQNCMVGCTSCKVWCIYDAITFPDKEIVRNFIKENKIINTSKEQLNELKLKTK